MSLNAAMDPLLYYLPKSLEAEEEGLLALEDGRISDDSMERKGGHVSAQRFSSRDTETSPSAVEKTLPAAPHKKPNFLIKWLRPDVYTDYPTMRRLVPRGFADISYSPETERDAYYHPAIKSPTPLLWIPRDSVGVSRQEIKHTSRVIPITDEGAGFDTKGKLIWDHEHGRPPIYEEKVYY